MVTTLPGSSGHRLSVFAEQAESGFSVGEKEETEVDALTKYLDDALQGIPSDDDDDEEEQDSAKGVVRDVDHLFQLLQHQDGKPTDSNQSALRKYKDEPLWRDEDVSLLRHYTHTHPDTAPPRTAKEPSHLLKSTEPKRKVVLHDSSAAHDDADLSDEEVRNERLRAAQQSTSTDALMAERQRILTKMETVQEDVQNTEVFYLFFY